MGKIIDIIRSWFCKHEWECIGHYDVCEFHPKYPSYHQWVYVCKKCMRTKKITT